MIELIVDLVFIDSRSDGTRSWGSARPLDRLVGNGKRNLEWLHSGCHLGEVRVGLAGVEESGVFGFADPVGCTIAEGVVLLGVEGARAEGVESVISAEDFPGEFDEAPEVALEFGVLVLERKLVEI